jgi:hypothetical protein
MTKPQPVPVPDRSELLQKLHPIAKSRIILRVAIIKEVSKICVAMHAYAIDDEFSTAVFGYVYETPHPYTERESILDLTYWREPNANKRWEEFMNPRLGEWQRAGYAEWFAPEPVIAVQLTPRRVVSPKSSLLMRAYEQLYAQMKRRAKVGPGLEAHWLEAASRRLDNLVTLYNMELDRAGELLVDA